MGAVYVEYMRDPCIILLDSDAGACVKFLFWNQSLVRVNCFIIELIWTSILENMCLSKEIWCWVLFILSLTYWFSWWAETTVCGSTEKTSDELQTRSNNSRYLYRQLHHVEKELGLLGPSRFPNQDKYNRAVRQVQGMKCLLEYHLPSSNMEGTGLDGGSSPEESINGDSTKKGGLPWWFVFVGWTLVIATSGVSGYFTMMYGLTYGKERSISWLISMVVSFFESLFITQPLKVS